MKGCKQYMIHLPKTYAFVSFLASRNYHGWLNHILHNTFVSEISFTPKSTVLPNVPKEGKSCHVHHI